MSSMKQHTDKAKFRYEDIHICMDGELHAKLAELENSAAAAVVEASQKKNARLAAPTAVKKLNEEIEALREQMNAESMTLRIRQLPSAVWNKIMATNPPRENFPPDQAKSYNTEAVTKQAVEAGTHLLTADGLTEPVSADEWPDFWENLSGGDFDRLSIAIHNLNERYGWNGGMALKKG